jgi:hypothetical protein
MVSSTVWHRARSLSNERSVAIVASIVLDGLSDCSSSLATREITRTLARDQRKSSPQLSSLFSFSLTVFNVRHRERSLALDRKITGDRVIDYSRLSWPKAITRCRLIVHWRSPPRLSRYLRHAFPTFVNESDHSLSIERSVAIVSWIVADVCCQERSCMNVEEMVFIISSVVSHTGQRERRFGLDLDISTNRVPD